MNNELSNVLSYMEKERGIDRELLIKAVESALQAVSKKSLSTTRDLRIQVDRETCEIKAFATVKVVESAPKTSKDKISLENARKIKPDVQLGDTVEIEATPRNLGRIAAQTAKQAIIQKIRQAEKDIVFGEYKDRIGDIVSGTVRQFERSDIIVDLGKAEAILTSKERVPTEEYQVGDRIRAYILSVQNNPSGPGIMLSRSHPDFVKSLFKLEVSEISDGVVEIKGISREAGYRSKIAVVSHDEKVDPVGACVGMRGMRVKNIVRELSGEKIDIIRWSDDIKTYVANALSPAKLSKVSVDPNHYNLVHVVVDADQLSLAIGKKGQNVRLSSRLIGWKIDIQKDESEVSFEEKVTKAVNVLAAIEGIGAEKARSLVQAGFLTMEGILAAEITDIVEMANLSAEDAKIIYDAVAAKVEALDQSGGDGAEAEGTGVSGMEQTE